MLCSITTPHGEEKVKKKNSEDLNSENFGNVFVNATEQTQKNKVECIVYSWMLLYKNYNFLVYILRRSSMLNMAVW